MRRLSKEETEQMIERCRKGMSNKRLLTGNDMYEWLNNQPNKTPVDLGIYVRNHTAELVRAETLKEVGEKLSAIGYFETLEEFLGCLQSYDMDEKLHQEALKEGRMPDAR